MASYYNKLWKLFINQKITKTQLCQIVKVSANAVAKLGRNKDIQVEVLVRICEALKCNLGDNMEWVSTEEEEE